MFGNAFRTVRTTLRATAKTVFAAGQQQQQAFSPAAAVLSRGMANHRHKKVLKLAKGYRGRANRCFTVAKQRVDKARQYAYVGRKVRSYDGVAQNCYFHLSKDKVTTVHQLITHKSTRQLPCV